MLFSASLCFFWEKTSSQTQTNPKQMWPGQCEWSRNLTSGPGDKQGWACKKETGVVWGREQG